MKKLFSLLSILFILGFFSTIYGQTTERTAVIVDHSGTSTEVRHLNVEELAYNYYGGRQFNKIAIITESFDIVIPIVNLISMEDTEVGTKYKRILEVSYYWMGKKIMISGYLDAVKFTGQSDFGGFLISSYDLKHLRFSQVSDKITQTKEFHPEGYITLRDGTKLEFIDLKRHDGGSVGVKKLVKDDGFFRYYESDIERADWYYDNIDFDRGDSELNVKFKDLKNIEFEDQNNRNIILTLKNGKSTKGEIKNSNKRDLDGLTGVFGKGEFYINRKNIRIVHFY